MKVRQKMQSQVIIIGGGIVGSFLAEKLVEEGLDVLLVEKRSETGKEACSGVVSERVNEFFDPERFLKNRLSTLEVNISGSRFEIDTDTLVLDRKKLDPFLIEKAKDSGTEIRMGEEALDINFKNDYAFLKTSSGSHKARIVVDCSGFSSFLERAKGLDSRKEVFSSALVRLEEKNPGERSEIYLDKDYSENFFAWKIPREHDMEYGVITKSNAQKALDKFIKDRGIDLKNNYRLMTHPIQIGKQKSVFKSSIALGESACQVKPLSGGGIVYGLVCSEVARKAILKSLEKGEFGEKFFEREYEDKWKEKIGKSIDLQLRFKEALYEKDFSSLNFPELSLDMDYDFLG